MSIEQKAKCEGCGIEKGETNHWWLVILGLAYQGVGVYPWNDYLAFQPKVKHFCGQSCLTKFLGAWLDQITRGPCKVPPGSADVEDEPMPLPFSASHRK